MTITQSRQLNVFKTQGPKYAFNPVQNTEPLYLHNPEKKCFYPGFESSALYQVNNLVNSEITNKKDFSTTHTWSNNNNQPNALPGNLKANTRDHIDDLLAASYAGVDKGSLLEVNNDFNFQNVKAQERVIPFPPFLYKNLH